MQKMKGISVWWFLFPAFAFLFVGCGEKKEATLGQMDFGVITPSHSVQKTLVLQFNDEARNDPDSFVEFMFLTKSGYRFPKNQIQFTVNGKVQPLKFYAHDFGPGPQDVKIGIHFTDLAKQQVYEGRFVVVDASHDLRQYITYGDKNRKVVVGDLTSGLSVQFRYLIPWPVWVKAVVYGGAAIVLFLVLWFVFLKKKLFLQFDGGSIEFLEPTQQDVRLRGLRLLYLGANERHSQGGLWRLFTGKVAHVMGDIPVGAIVYPVKLRNKVSHKIKNDSSTMMEPMENTLYDFAEYKLNDSTEQKVRFVYKNSKHQPPI